MGQLSKNSRKQIVLWALIIAIVLGWIVGYANSVYFNQERVMNQRAPISSMESIGGDLSILLNYSKEVIKGNSPYTDKNFYPPLVYVLTAPLLLLTPPLSYFLLSVLSVASVCASLFLSVKIFGTQKTNKLLVAVIFILSLFSYGLSFELERGQIYSISMLLIILSMYFTKKNHLWLSIIAFTLAVQFKLTFILFLPLIFAFLNSKQLYFRYLLKLFVLNLICIFILGYEIAIQFIDQIMSKSTQPFLWVGNHSLFAYCSNVTVGICNQDLYPFILGICLIIVLITIILILQKKAKTKLFFPFAIFGLAALVIPNENHDYNLIAVPLILMPMINEMHEKYIKNGNVLFLFVFINSIFLFMMTIFSFTTAWRIFPLSVNKAPVLVLLMMVVFIGLTGEYLNNFIKKFKRIKNLRIMN